MFLIKDPSHFYLRTVACLSISFPVPLQFLFFKLQATYSCDCDCEHSKCTGTNTRAQDSHIRWHTKACAHKHSKKDTPLKGDMDLHPADLLFQQNCENLIRAQTLPQTGRNEEPPLLNVHLCIQLYVRTTQALINNTCMLWILVSSLHATATLQNELQLQLQQCCRVFQPIRVQVHTSLFVILYPSVAFLSGP